MALAWQRSAQESLESTHMGKLRPPKGAGPARSLQGSEVREGVKGQQAGCDPSVHAPVPGSGRRGRREDKAENRLPGGTPTALSPGRRLSLRPTPAHSRSSLLT